MSEEDDQENVAPARPPQRILDAVCGVLTQVGMLDNEAAKPAGERRQLYLTRDVTAKKRRRFTPVRVVSIQRAEGKATFVEARAQTPTSEAAASAAATAPGTPEPFDLPFGCFELNEVEADGTRDRVRGSSRVRAADAASVFPTDGTPLKDLRKEMMRASRNARER